MPTASGDPDGLTIEFAPAIAVAGADGGLEVAAPPGYARPIRITQEGDSYVVRSEVQDPRIFGSLDAATASAVHEADLAAVARAVALRSADQPALTPGVSGKVLVVNRAGTVVSVPVEGVAPKDLRRGDKVVVNTGSTEVGQVTSLKRGGITVSAPRGVGDVDPSEVVGRVTGDVQVAKVTVNPGGTATVSHAQG